MLTMADLHQEEGLSRSEMDKVAGGAFADDIGAGIKATAEKALNEGGGVDNQTAGVFLAGIAAGVGYGLMLLG